MARRSSVAAVITGIVTTLRNSTEVTGLVGTTGIYNNVEPSAAFPYLVVTCPTDVPQDTFGRFGVDARVDVRAVSQYPGDKEAADIVNAGIQALHFQHPSASGHTLLGVAYDSGDRFSEVVNGIVTRHHVATFRVWTEQSSS